MVHLAILSCDLVIRAKETDLGFWTGGPAPIRRYVFRGLTGTKLETALVFSHNTDPHPVYVPCYHGVPAARHRPRPHQKKILPIKGSQQRHRHSRERTCCVVPSSIHRTAASFLRLLSTAKHPPPSGTFSLSLSFSSFPVHCYRLLSHQDEHSLLASIGASIDSLIDDGYPSEDPTESATDPTIDDWLDLASTDPLQLSDSCAALRRLI